MTSDSENKNNKNTLKRIRWKQLPQKIWIKVWVKLSSLAKPFVFSSRVLYFSAFTFDKGFSSSQRRNLSVSVLFPIFWHEKYQKYMPKIYIKIKCLV